MAPRKALRTAALGALLGAASALTRVRLHKTDGIALAGRLLASGSGGDAALLDKTHPVALSNFMDAQARASWLPLDAASKACARRGRSRLARLPPPARAPRRRKSTAIQRLSRSQARARARTFNGGLAAPQ